MQFLSYQVYGAHRCLSLTSTQTERGETSGAAERNIQPHVSVSYLKLIHRGSQEKGCSD